MTDTERLAALRPVGTDPMDWALQVGNSVAVYLAECAERDRLAQGVRVGDPPREDAGGLRAALQWLADHLDGFCEYCDDDRMVDIGESARMPCLGSIHAATDKARAALAAQPAPHEDGLRAALEAADEMAEAWAKGGWRISTDYHTIEVAYERYLMARTK